MNDLTTIGVAPILTGQKYRLKDEGPWPSTAPVVTVIAVKDGWIRYTTGIDDMRRTEESFRRAFERAEEDERSEEEKLRERFERWAAAHHWPLQRMDRVGYEGQYFLDYVQRGFGAFCAGARGEGI